MKSRPLTARKASNYINYIRPQTKVHKKYKIQYSQSLSLSLSLSKIFDFVIGGSLAGTTPVIFLKETIFLILCRNQVSHTLFGQIYQLTNLASLHNINYEVIAQCGFITQNYHNELPHYCLPKVTKY